MNRLKSRIKIKIKKRKNEIITIYVYNQMTNKLKLLIQNY